MTSGCLDIAAAAARTQKHERCWVSETLFPGNNTCFLRVRRILIFGPAKNCPVRTNALIESITHQSLQTDGNSLHYKSHRERLAQHGEKSTCGIATHIASKSAEKQFSKIKGCNPVKGKMNFVFFQSIEWLCFKTPTPFPPCSACLKAHAVHSLLDVECNALVIKENAKNIDIEVW